MKNINSYENFIILEKFDDNITFQLKKLGVENKLELDEYLDQAHKGHLKQYLNDKGKKFTFGMLIAIFKDARDAKRKTELKTGIIKAAHRIIPMALAPFFPIVAIIGYILGTSRAFNKVIAPILAEPGNDYPEFLKKIIDKTMRVAEGDLTEEKDRFTRAFVVSDGIIDVVKPEILQKFSYYLSDKMSKENPDSEVPHNYIENELKTYLNDKYGIKPQIPLIK